VSLTRYFTRRQEVEAELRSKKVPVYEGFIRNYVNLMMSGSDGRSDDDETAAFIREFSEKMTIWGADEVLKLWATFRRQGGQPSSDPLALMTLFENVMLAMRRDLGHKNKGLVSHDLLSLFVNDLPPA
jgi:hypothetical protein